MLRLIRVAALIIVVLVLLGLNSRWFPTVGQPAQISYSTFLDDVSANRVASVVFQGDMVYGTLKDRQQFKTHKPEGDDSVLIGTLRKAGLPIDRRPPRRATLPWLLTLLASLLLIVFFVRRPADS